MKSNLMCLPLILLMLSSQLIGCALRDGSSNRTSVTSNINRPLNETMSTNGTKSYSATSTYTPLPTVTSTYTPLPTVTSTYTPSPTVTSTYTPSPTVTSTPTLAPIFLVPFRDDFSGQTRGLLPEDYTNLVTEYVDSSFRMNIMEPQFTQLSDYKLNFPNDVSITADISFGKHPDTWMGIAYRMRDEANYYMFAVDGQANYKIFRVTSAGPISNPSYNVDVIFESYIPLLAERNFLVTKIRVDMTDNRFQFFANDILLTSLEKDTFPQGGIGLIGWTTDNPDSIIFNNLEVVDYQKRILPNNADCTLIKDPVGHTVSNPDLRINSLGALGIDSSVRMSVKPNDLSAAFAARTLDADDLIWMSRLTAPNGAVLYDINVSPDEECANNLHFSGSCAAEGEINLLFPSNPKFPLLSGDYEIELYSMGNPICDAATIIRTDTSPNTRFANELQAIDINIWVLSTTEALTVTEERNRMKDEIRESIDNLLAQQNMRLGKLSLFDSSPADKEAFSQADETDLANLCQATSLNIGSSRSLNVALIDVFQQYYEIEDDYFPVLGMSPIPGMSFATESQNSCVVISLEQHEANYRYVGSTIVHEGSHFMGLTHTTEANGVSFDLFDDTPECPLGQYDLDESGEVEEQECLEVDSSNYMFWQDSGYINNFIISNQQAWVIRSHPLFYTLYLNQ